MSKLSRRKFLAQAPLAAAVAASPRVLGTKNTDAIQQDKESSSASNSRNKAAGASPFSLKDLLSSKIRDTYEGDHLNRVAFAMGGIGTGCISLAGTGKLIDWEIFNNPNRGYQPYHSFLSVWAQQEGGKSAFRVLEGQIRGSLEGPYYLTKEMWPDGNGCGPLPTEAVGLPRMRECKFVGRFPFAHVELADPSLPVTAKVEGWSPFIPGNAKDSSLPVAALNVTLHNPGNKRVKAAIAMSMQNCAGAINEMVRESEFSAMHMHAGSDNENAMFVASPEPTNSWQMNWSGTMLFMYLQHFANTFGANGVLDYSPSSQGQTGAAKNDFEKVGSIAFEMNLGPGESKTIPLIIGWYFPSFDTASPTEQVPKGKPWRNYYGAEWKSGLDVARYTVANLPRLEADTRLFQQDFWSSTLPGVVLEAASTQLSILRSPTIIRYPDGTIYGWEGCTTNRRLGFGTCNHVWNYQQTIPYLFPELQRSILNNFYNNGFRESDGAIQFRVPAGPGAKASEMPAIYQAPFSASDSQNKTNFFCAADGQFGMIAQVYRDWHISGDTEWLKAVWPRVKKSLEYAWTVWDPRRVGLLEGSHHNTLDLNFTTPETMCGSEYQVALLAGEKMALAMGNREAAAEYRRVYESGKTLSDKELFNGEYYQQKLPAPGVYQLGPGCISDQVTGQLYARMLDLEDIYDPNHIQSALGSVYRYNYRESFDDVVNTDRGYSLNDDRGLMIATWPRGDRPDQPLLYCYETMPGFEYQVAFNLLYSGQTMEGLTVIKSIRDRFDGKKRNPFCEIEWGNHYARSMIAYTGMLALSRFRYSGVEHALQFAPQLNHDNFRQFFSVASGWGVLSQSISSKKQVVTVSVSKGFLEVSEFRIHTPAEMKAAAAHCGGEHAKASALNNPPLVVNPDGLSRVTLEKALKAQPDNPIRLEVELA
jgi:non-lysosomal glucosylceramidase